MVDVKLDDKMAFYAWIQAGSLEKASKLLALQGSYNPNTGMNWNPGSIRQASQRYTLNNVEEVRQIYKDHGSMLNEKQWEVKLLIAACKIHSRKNFIIWVDENQWALKYPMIINKRFPGLAEILKENVNEHLSV